MACWIRVVVAVFGVAWAGGLDHASGAAAVQPDSMRSDARKREDAAAPGDSIPGTPEILITATRWGLPERATAASVASLDSRALEATAALTVDDALRQVPGFTLFRRSGSRTANPTTQGVSLRGLGGSGASRALVLWDGVPLNDPFGGWVSWARVPALAIERIEMTRGGGADLYGNAALGGVVRIVPQWSGPQREPRIELESTYGEEGTHDAALRVSGSASGWRGDAIGASFVTDGYTLVAPGARGSIDVAARSRHTAMQGRVERRISARWRAHAAIESFEESRGNGTPFQENGTRLHQWSGGAAGSALGGEIDGRAYFAEQRFHQNFSAIGEGRASETPTRTQNVPAIARGASVQWRRGGERRHVVVLGSDVRDARGTNEETALPSGAFTSVRGRQFLWSGFAAGRLRLTPRLWLGGGARLDAWENFDASRCGGGAIETVAGRRDHALSPQASIFYEASGAVAVWAAAFGGFRAPTLNELYRSFRVGDVMTLANENLEAETLVGREIGVKTAPAARLRADAAFFWMNVENTIANVTIQTEPDLITRQRRNLGEIRSRGVELDLTAGPFGAWSVSGGYLYADSRVIDFSADRELEGLRVPQTPAHHITAQCRYLDERGRRAALQARWVGEQFDDDRNRFRLAPFFALDALAAHPLSSRIEIFAAAENLLDERHEVGRTPAPTIGPPRAFRVGVTLASGGRS